MTLPTLLNRCFVYSIASIELLRKMLKAICLAYRSSVSEVLVRVVLLSSVFRMIKYTKSQLLGLRPFYASNSLASIRWAILQKEGWHVRLRGWSVYAWSFSWSRGWEIEYIAKGFYYGANQDMANHPFFGLNLY